MRRYESHVAPGIISRNARAYRRRLRRRWRVVVAHIVNTGNTRCGPNDEYWSSECYAGARSIGHPIFHADTDSDRHPGRNADRDADARYHFNAGPNRDADAVTLFANARFRRRWETFFNPRVPKRPFARDSRGRLIAVEVQADRNHGRTAEVDGAKRSGPGPRLIES
jgi:hypothetical protein